eukprot:461985_1
MATVGNKDVFTICKMENSCDQDDISQCLSAQRIQIILNEFNKIIQIQTHTYDQYSTLIENIFTNNHYSNTDLLNDFHHIKYDHNADDDDIQFQQIYTFFMEPIKDICQQKQCKHIQRHFLDRSKLINECTSNNSSYTLRLISRIHVYFIHSYHINRLTMHEVNRVNEQLDGVRKLDLMDDNKQMEELLSAKKIEMETAFIKKKTNKLNIIRNNDKFIAAQDAGYSIENSIDIQKIYQILINHDVFIDEKQLRCAFAKYEDKNLFVSDIIDAYSLIDNKFILPVSSKIATEYLPN